MRANQAVHEPFCNVATQNQGVQDEVCSIRFIVLRKAVLVVNGVSADLSFNVDVMQKYVYGLDESKAQKGLPARVLEMTDENVAVLSFFCAAHGYHNVRPINDGVV